VRALVLHGAQLPDRVVGAGRLDRELLLQLADPLLVALDLLAFLRQPVHRPEALEARLLLLLVLLLVGHVLSCLSNRVRSGASRPLTSARSGPPPGRGCRRAARPRSRGRCAGLPCRPTAAAARRSG